MKLLLLDKDGTLVQPASGAKFVNQPWDQEALPGAKEAIDRYVADGWKPVIVSNQGGVEKGHKTLQMAIEEFQFCLELFPQIEEAFFCPDFEGANCWRVWGNCDDAHQIKYDANWLTVEDLGIALQFRKPNSGMLKLAIVLHGADEALMVGDRPEDQGAAEAAGIPFMWAEEWRK